MPTVAVVQVTSSEEEEDDGVSSVWLMKEITQEGVISDSVTTYVKLLCDEQGTRSGCRCSKVVV